MKKLLMTSLLAGAAVLLIGCQSGEETEAPTEESTTISTTVSETDTTESTSQSTTESMSSATSESTTSTSEVEESLWDDDKAQSLDTD